MRIGGLGSFGHGRIEALRESGFVGSLNLKNLWSGRAGFGPAASVYSVRVSFELASSSNVIYCYIVSRGEFHMFFWIHRREIPIRASIGHVRTRRLLIGVVRAARTNMHTQARSRFATTSIVPTRASR